jgi:alpha-L-rhamnosidase
MIGAPRKKEAKAKGGASVTSSSAPRVVRLTTEGRVDPLGLDVTAPRFGWQITDDGEGLTQKGYRLIVASDPDTLRLGRGDLWDSGAVNSAQSQGVAYGGPALRPNQACYWQVRVVTNHGTTDWSAPARWSVGLLREGQWQGVWIGCDRPFSWDDEGQHSRLSARYLRRTFALRGPVRRATLHIAGLGRYEAYLNGQRIGTAALAPAPTDFRRDIIYDTYDVTGLLPAEVLTLPAAEFPPRERTATVQEPQATRLCLAVILGNGRYFAPRQHYRTDRIAHFGYPKLRAQLVLEYTDGTQEVVATDTNWKFTAAGPIRSNNELDGEEYDAQRLSLMQQWMQPDYNDDFWLDAEPVSVPEGELVGNLTPPVEVVGTLYPVAVRGNILDFGRVLTGRLRLPVGGLRRGAQIRVRYAEELGEEGDLDFADYEAADAADTYTASGSDTGTWAPSFVTHTFRYAEVTGLAASTLTGSTAAQTNTFSGVVAEVISDPMRRTGWFACSDTALTHYVEEEYHRLRTQYQGVPLTDADNPQPWLAPHAATCVGESYLLDNRTLYTKWLDDLARAQRSDGALPDVAPAFWRSYSSDTLGPSLLAAGVQMLYDQYGDERPRLQYAEAIRRWRDYLSEAQTDEAAYALPTDSLAYCFARIGGIRPLVPGYAQVLLAPDFTASGLTWADVSYDSPYGRIRSHWRRTGDSLEWEVEIPGNATARLQLPAEARTETLQGLPKSARKKVKNRSLTLGAGRYKLTLLLQGK